MKSLKVLFFIACLVAMTSAYSQDSLTTSQDSTKKVRPLRVCYFYPIGSNGLDAYKIENVVSINIYMGISGGVQAAEFAGFGNITNGNVTGFQGAGFFNLNKGNINGFQGSGFFNAVKGDIKGVQATGFVNANHGKINGIQGSGFVNVNTGNFRGAQATGFVNVNVGKFNGLQASGFLNTTVKDFTGAQLSGYVNTAHKNFKGVQASGFLNFVQDTIQGSQFSGFANYAKAVKGFQVGMFNVCDTVSKGLPIGFLSFVRKGYHKGEIEYGTNLIGSASFKTGVKRFYNILSLAATPIDGKVIWGAGYGIGTLFPIHNKLDMNIDLVSTQFIDDTQDDKLNLMNRLKINVAYKLSKYLHVYGGPSIDVLVHDKNVKSVMESPVYSWNNGNNSTLTKMTFGFNAGLRF